MHSIGNLKGLARAGLDRAAQAATSKSLSSLSFAFEALALAQKGTPLEGKAIVVNHDLLDYLRHVNDLARGHGQAHDQTLAQAAAGAADSQLPARTRHDSPLHKAAAAFRENLQTALKAATHAARGTAHGPATLIARFDDQGMPTGPNSRPSNIDLAARDMVQRHERGTRHLLIGPSLKTLFDKGYLHEGKHLTVIQPSVPELARLQDEAAKAGLKVQARGQAGTTLTHPTDPATSLTLVGGKASQYDPGAQRFHTISDLNAACIYEPTPQATTLLARLKGALVNNGLLLASVKSAADRQQDGINLRQLLKFASDHHMLPSLKEFCHMVDFKQAGGGVEQGVVRVPCEGADPDVLDKLADVDEAAAQHPTAVCRYTMLLQAPPAPAAPAAALRSPAAP